MHRRIVLATLSLLAGCACVAPVADPELLGPEARTLPLYWVAPGVVSLELDGERFEGAASSAPCWSDICRGPYRNVPKPYRRLVLKWQAELVAKDGSHLECAWLSYREALQGSCHTWDGRVYRLAGG